MKIIFICIIYSFSQKYIIFFFPSLTVPEFLLHVWVLHSWTGDGKVGKWSTLNSSCPFHEPVNQPSVTLCWSVWDTRRHNYLFSVTCLTALRLCGLCVCARACTIVCEPPNQPLACWRNAFSDCSQRLMVSLPEGTAAHAENHVRPTRFNNFID